MRANLAASLKSRTASFPGAPGSCKLHPRRVPSTLSARGGRDGPPLRFGFGRLRLSACGALLGPAFSLICALSMHLPAE